MVRENRYLGAVFGEIVKKVIEHLIRTKLKQNKDVEEDFESLSDGGLWTLRELVKDLFGVKIGCSDLSNKLSIIIRSRNNDLEHDIDFTDEINCLTCVHYIFSFFKNEYDCFTYRDGSCTFNKDKRESMWILEKKNLILSILDKCVDNFSIDQELKDKAKKMIQNTAKYNKASFLTEEKEDIEEILKSLKFRLDNIIELEKHDVLDRLILDDALPDDIDDNNYVPDSVDEALRLLLNERLIIEKEQIRKNKSELINIVKETHNSMLDCIKEQQLKIIPKSDSNSTDIDDQKQHQPISSQEYPKQSSQVNRPSKEKKIKKRKSKSNKINHVLS